MRAPKPVKKNPRMGRPEIPYTEEIATKICNLIATCPDSLSKICRDNPDIPSKEKIMSWVAYKDDFSVLYMEAKRRQIHSLIEHGQAVTLDTSNDFYDTPDGPKPNPVSVARAALIAKQINWQAGRLMPRIYGERVDLETKTAELQKTVDDMKRSTEELVKKYEREC